MEKTALQQLKEKLQTVVDDLKDAIPGTDQYGYRDAMRNVILDIDMQMIPVERDAIVDAVKFGLSEDWFVPDESKVYSTWDACQEVCDEKNKLKQLNDI